MADERLHLFDHYTLDRGRGTLLRGDEPVHLRPQAYELLDYLAERRGRLVSKDQIIGHIWQAWLRQTQRDSTESHTSIRVAFQLVQDHQVSLFWPLPSAACYQARLWIAQGNLSAASRWAETAGIDAGAASSGPSCQTAKPLAP